MVIDVKYVFFQTDTLVVDGLDTKVDILYLDFFAVKKQIYICVLLSLLLFKLNQCCRPLHFYETFSSYPRPIRAYQTEERLYLELGIAEMDSKLYQLCHRLTLNILLHNG